VGGASNVSGQLFASTYCGQAKNKGVAILTCKAVRHSDILSIILAQQDTDYSLPCALGSSVVVVDNGQQDEGRNGDMFRDEGERLGGSGWHFDGLR
jgi:hypothetical protein